MKKSEFEQKLAVLLCTFPWPPLSKENNIDMRELSKYIVHSVRKLGMIPPPYDKEDETCGVYEKFEWEHEKETLEAYGILEEIDKTWRKG